MKPRVRFAPAPTGLMHLGNVRTALLNYLFAKKYNGTFILRLEDTDPDRNFDPNGKQIIEDLHWLDLFYDEGPNKDGSYGPYQQSLRTHIYQDKLTFLINKKAIYRCFCSPHELELKRKRQIALKQPPRYDRTCAQLTEAQIAEKLANNIAFIWRFKVPDHQTVIINEMARGQMHFALKNFSDFPITRSDGTFTFIFANAIDDILMKISHVLRGQDHLSNTVNQIMILNVFEAPIPTYWHLPIICNAEGKKLSKRDFGFSLNDLRQAGFLPEAINNYLAILGESHAQEIMNMQELITLLNFDNVSAASHIKYDPEKLRWINHKWIQLYDTKKLTALAKPILCFHYPQASTLSDTQLRLLVQSVKSELYTLQDIIPALNFYFQKPILTRQIIIDHIPDTIEQQLFALLKKNLVHLSNIDDFLQHIKHDAAQIPIPNKLLFGSLRLILTGSIQGASIKDILTILGERETKERIEKVIYT